MSALTGPQTTGRRRCSQTKRRLILGAERGTHHGRGASSDESSLARTVAAAVPSSYWGSFFPALLVRGTGVDDPPHPVGRMAGVPANVFWAGVTTASAFAGWLVDARVRSTTRHPMRTR
jgi:hypothetical protein